MNTKVVTYNAEPGFDAFRVEGVEASGQYVDCFSSTYVVYAHSALSLGI